MFVSSRRYNELKRQFEAVKFALKISQKDRAKDIDDYNGLVDRYNILSNKVVEMGNTALSKEEINSLIRLCHPDKHNGKESASRMTQKLLEMREAVSEP
jgi:predicted ATP-dependent Lon-type protease